MTKQLTAQDWGRLIGCKVRFVYDFYLDFNEDSYEAISTGVTEACDKIYVHNRKEAIISEYCQPILRTFDQMTEDERKELIEIISEDRLGEINHVTIDKRYGTIEFTTEGSEGRTLFPATIGHTRWLESRFFDIDNHIKRGLAVKEVADD